MTLNCDWLRFYFGIKRVYSSDLFVVSTIVCGYTVENIWMDILSSCVLQVQADRYILMSQRTEQ